MLCFCRKCHGRIILPFKGNIKGKVKIVCSRCGHQNTFGHFQPKDELAEERRKVSKSAKLRPQDSEKPQEKSQEEPRKSNIDATEARLQLECARRAEEYKRVKEQAQLLEEKRRLREEESERKREADRLAMLERHQNRSNAPNIGDISTSQLSEGPFKIEDD